MLLIRPGGIESDLNGIFSHSNKLGELDSLQPGLEKNAVHWVGRPSLHGLLRPRAPHSLLHVRGCLLQVTLCECRR